jgi:soluble lytic murein transglycosylase
MFFNKRTKSSYRKKLLYIVVFLLIVVAPIYIWIYYQTDNSAKFNKLIFQKSKKYSLDPNLVKAVIWRESDFNVNAVGLKGEIGLMQLMPKAAVKDWENYYNINLVEKGVLFNPNLNIEIGCWYLARCRRHWRKYKDPEMLMLAEYNAGYTNVKKWFKQSDKKYDKTIERIKFKSTKKYVNSIMSKYKKYSQQKRRQK